MNIKRILRIGLLSLLVVFFVLLAFIYFRFDDILLLVKNQIEEQTKTEINYDDASMGIFNKFPLTSITVIDFEITDRQTGTGLLKGDKVIMSFNPVKLLMNKSQIDIIQLGMEAPELKWITDESGQNNWQNLLKTSEDSSDKETGLIINGITINGGKLVYTDRATRSNYEFNDVVYSGNFETEGDSIFHNGDMNGSISLDKNSLIHLDDYRVTLSSNIRGDTRQNVYAIRESSLTINDLMMRLNGLISISNGSLSYDFDLASIEQDFRNLLSIVTDVFPTQGSNVGGQGQFSIQGRLSGIVDKDVSYPIYNLKLDVPNGRFSLPSFPNDITNLSLNANLINDNKSSPITKAVIPTFTLEQGGDQVKGSFTMSNERRDTRITLDIDSDIKNLKRFNDLIKADIQGGSVNMKSKGDFYLSDIQKSNFQDSKFSMAGRMADISAVADSSSLSIKELIINGDIQSVDTKINRLVFGESDISGVLSFSNALAILIQDGAAIKFDGDITSDRINLNEFLVSTTTTEQEVAYPNLNGSLNFIGNEVVYQGYTMSDLNFKGDLSSDKLTIKAMKTQIGASDAEITGTLRNIKSYLEGKSNLTGTLDLRSDFVDLAELERFAYDPSFNQPDSASQKDIFEGLDLKIISSSDRLTYDKTSLINNLASIGLKDNELKLNELRSRSFGGELIMEGKFILDQDNNAVDLKADFANIGIAEALSSLPFFKKLGYPLQFITGKVNTTLTLQSLLDNDYNFILSEIDAFGLLETLDGKLVGFEPVEKLNQYLNLGAKKEYAVKQSKNWVTIKDGWVQVDPFNFQIDDSKFKVQGAHSLKNELNYNISAEVPSRILAKLDLKNKVSSDLFAKLNKYRNTKDDNVGLFFSMTGDFSKPIIKLNEIDVVSAGKELVKETIQTAKDTISSTIDSLKIEAKNRVNDTLDVLQQKAEKKADQVIDSLKTKIKDEAKTRIDSTLSTKLDSLGGKIINETGVADTLKQKINRLKDLFKKKKNE